ncbi:MAG: type II secretion system F family protein [Candidatus Pacebacteria bacterium]|jgi:type IV pilus assembly protein PilC|nr:type II secretion system F family protein [Candidatus Paceibacterota bacterium]MBP9058191.1 type II secretion system F family protein [Candidatus Paceibacterota bacterium]MBP9769891.1 type II secretion system F family protein [Candidatus Paceibacterota bacterium]
MNFKYKAIEENGVEKEGLIAAANQDLAIASLQRRGMIIVSIREEGKKKGLEMTIFEKVPQKEIVILSRQISTLFEAQVSALKAFSLVASTTDNDLLKRKLNQVVDDLQAGYSISGALAKHNDVFSDFYVNMVKAGEESGKLNQTFGYLADYLDRNYELTSKTKNALIYPIFVIITFFAVMTLMLTMVIPKLSQIITESGQDVPLYTKVVIGFSNFLVDYGIVILAVIVAGVLYLIRLSRSGSGKKYLDNLKLTFPALGNLFRKLYLSRIADNLDTMISAGIPIVRALQITGEVVGNRVYKDIIKEAEEGVKAGNSLSASFEKNPEYIPTILIQMIKVGEETGSLSSILKTLAKFYKREVDAAVDTIVGLIEPIMIVALGLGVGFLLASVLVPIYNLASGIA